jgi:protease-4
MKNKPAWILIALLAAAGCHVHFDLLGKEEIAEVVLKESRVKDKILLLDISGIIGIMSDPGLLPRRDGNVLSQVYFRLEQAEADPLVKGIILRLDTPGGEVTASEILYNEIREFRSRTGKPVVALMMGMSTSGGYYVASACDSIVAHPSTITGSIGVISIFPNLEELFNKVGVKMTVIKSGRMKDSGSPFRDMKDEEREVFQDIVDGFHEQFLEAVIEGRREHLTMERLRDLADGRVYTAPHAEELGLIDRVGYFDDAYRDVLERAGLSGAKVIAYSYYPGTKTNIYATRLDGSFALERPELERLARTLEGGFYYLWIPQWTH